MIYQLRRPDFRIIISRPNYAAPGAYAETEIASFRSDVTNRLLISYNYRQEIANFESPFSLVFTPETLDSSGNTILEKLRPLDVVKIEEYGQVKYLGLINSRRYAATMTESGPDRMIVVSGYGVGGILGRFNILLDQVILADANTTVDALERPLRALMTELSGEYGANTSMTHVFRKIAEAFRAAQEQVGGFTSGTGVYKVIDKYLAFSSDSDRLQSKYPMALSVFSYGGSNLLQIWQELVYKPFYEFFVRWDEPSNAYLLHLRPTPFEPESWLSLKKTDIDPVQVSSVDIGFSDNEVKTWFFAYLSGGALSYENARYNAQAVAIEKDKGKWALYGFRPLEAAFKYVDYTMLSDNGGNITVSPSAIKGDVLKEGGTVGDEKLMKEYSSKMLRWFNRADEMATGTLTAMTVRDSPIIGNRLGYKGVEFYIEAVDGSWQYGSEMQSRFTLTRGGVYNTNFAIGSAESSSNWWFRPAQVVALK